MSPEEKLQDLERPPPELPPRARRFFHWEDDSSSDSSEADSPEALLAALAPPRPETETERYERFRSTRRQNARLIIGNMIPDMSSPEEMPYCVWYPGLATEDTYRELARRYPAMRYQVGRACAVAGYAGLYLELGLLPDVSIAEEARGSGNEGSTAIFDHIMSQPTRYAVLDDYRRTVNLDNPQADARLNGDTAICPPPDKRNGDEDQHWIWPSYFDITEEWCGRRRPEDPSWTQDTNLPRRFTNLLHLPLPLDLPTTLKDNLILMAAYEGNVDRYHRLRRPVMLDDEEAAVIRGIYHSTSFALYWEKCGKGSGFEYVASPFIDMAITARHVMVNDLSRIPERLDEHCPPWCFPRLIWHPLFPQPETLMELIRRQPNNLCIRRSVALASIAADYQWIYDSIKPYPCWRLWQQAMKSPNLHYREDLKRRVATGEYPPNKPNEFPDFYSDWYPQEAKDLRPTTTMLAHFSNGPGIVEPNYEPRPDACWEVEANAASWELYMCTPDELRDQVDEGTDGYLQLYEDWKYDRGGWRRSLPWYSEEKAKSGPEETQDSEGTEDTEDVKGTQEAADDTKKAEDLKQPEDSRKAEVTPKSQDTRNSDNPEENDERDKKVEAEGGEEGRRGVASEEDEDSRVS